MSRKGQRIIASAFLAFAAIAAGADASAQGKGDKVAAEALFQEGRRLLDEGRLEQACPKLAESQQIDPAVGTLLYLGDCYERSGKTATAWATFHSAASAAAAAGQAPRQKIALDKATALEPKLSRMTVVVPSESQIEGLEIKRDGLVLGRPIWGTAVPVDPGDHELIVSAPGRTTWKTTVKVAAGAAKESVSIPVLEKAPEAAGAVTPPAGDSSAAAVQPQGEQSPAADVKPASKWGTQRVLGISAAGLGVVGLAVGTIYGLKMKSSQDDAKANCLDYPKGCNAEGLAANDDAKGAGTMATVGFIAGGALIAAGAVLYLTAPSPKPARQSATWTVSPLAGRGEGGLLLRGAW